MPRTYQPPGAAAGKIPDGVATQDAACVAVAYATVEHMLFDNARLEPGETVLVHAGGSGIGSIAIRIAKSIGCTVITTVGSRRKGRKGKGARRRPCHQLPRGPVRGRGPEADPKEGRRRRVRAYRRRTWAGSLLSLKRGGRLVTCGATSGPTASLNLMQLFQQQYRIIGSFGAPMSALARALDRIAAGVRPVIDTVYRLDDFRAGWTGWKRRDVFGKILIEL